MVPLKCDPGVGADALFDQLYRKPPMVMLLGAACSDVSKHIAQILPFWNLVMLSYASTSVALTNREEYPTFYRTVSPDSAHDPAKTALLQYFKWEHVGVLFQDEEIFSAATSKMIDYLEAYSNITIVAAEGFVDDPTSQIAKLKEADARVIIGNFFEKEARRVFCEAYKRGMYGGKYIWILVGWYQSDWWMADNDTDCTVEELQDALNGYIAVESLNRDIQNRTTVSGLTPNQFEELLIEHGEGLTTYAPQTYDAVWAIGLIMKTLSEENVTKVNRTTSSLEQAQYRNSYLRDKIKSILSHLSFVGISGHITFNGADRESITVFDQNQDGKMKRIAIYNPLTEYLDFNATDCVPILWQDGKVPRDRLLVIEEIVHIDGIAFTCITLMSIGGVLISILFLLFNLRYRNTKFIKLSSPNLNNLVIIGSILVYLCLILLGLNSTIVKNTTILTVLCSVRAFLLAAGFSLAFGSLFIKTYRVYHIFTRAASGVLRTKMLQESRLFLMVTCLFVFDTIVLVIWICMDPLHMKEQILPSTTRDEDDILYIPIIEQCTCNRMDIWLGILYAYKGLLLLFGAFLAWETRKVKIEALNDSQYIGMSVYNVMLMSIITVIISNVIGTGQQVTTTFLVISTFILISTTNTLCLLFLPKIYAMKRTGGKDRDHVTLSTGLEVKGRTRRFLCSERQDFRERLFRAEVQNRAFKKELSRLDVQINNLEEELEELLSTEISDTDETSLLVHSDGDARFPASTSSELLMDIQETDISNYYEIENQRKQIATGDKIQYVKLELSEKDSENDPHIFKISKSSLKSAPVRTFDNVEYTSLPTVGNNNSNSKKRICDKTNSHKNNTHILSVDDHEREMIRLRNEILRLQKQLAELDSCRIVYYV
uniref:Gamma-aminobutyric acid type B receptor subunit 2-like n=1 Tax=Saccoglossus kowalevskii TaxID=10224 RepID=A0ABM0MW48_SACKO|nr:PREDICTED: gamma-aminobutyric acid type B receptor subunit 2-like [Saccoglossus kowalevskii]